MTVAVTPTPRARVLAMPEYHPPLASRALLRLDFNENTFAPSPRVVERLRAITADGLTTYPEREHAEIAAARHFGLAPEQLLLTNGVDEAIHLICLTFLEEGDEALIATPTFFMYDVSVGLMTGGLMRIQSDESLEFPLDRFLAAITPRTRLIMIASPNNPTGRTVSRADLLAVCRAAPQAVVFIDEAYYHFHGETTLGDIGSVPNLLVGRTFSKAYGLANLRLGMLAGSAELMRYIRKVASPYNVNGIALAVLPEALADQVYLDWYVGQVAAGRTRVMAALDRLGVRYWKSEANFVLFDIGPRHQEFVQRMREKGVLLRDRSSDPGCDGYVRITIGIEDHVTRGIAALEETLKEMQWTR
jgi:histidinol-phosphate aminotransferase